MADSFIKVEVKGFDEAKKVLGEFYTKIGKKFDNEVKDWAFRTERKAKNNAKTVMKQRTGNLRSSITSRVDKTHGKWKWTVHLLAGGKKAPYAEVQEKGGTIKPKNKQFLTIPFKGAIGKVAGDWPKSQKLVHDGIIWELTSSRNALKRPLFSLHKSVTIKAKPYMHPAVVDMLPKLKENLIDAWKWKK